MRPPGARRWVAVIKTGKVSGVRFNTLNAICDALDCQPGDILEYVPDGESDSKD